MHSELRSLWRALLSLCFSHVCVICKKQLDLDEDHLCSECYHSLSYLPAGCCLRCAHPLPLVYETTHACMNCTGRILYYKSTKCLFLLNNSMKDLLHQIKYYRKYWLLNIFEEATKQEIPKRLKNTRVDYIIPIPLSPLKMITRGFNQAEIIARLIGHTIQKPLLTNVLRKRSNLSQTSLNRNQRLTNPQGTFMIRRTDRIAGKHILIVDDIYTTGSTVNECARVLMENGARSINVFTLARTI